MTDFNKGDVLIDERGRVLFVSRELDATLPLANASRFLLGLLVEDDNGRSFVWTIEHARDWQRISEGTAYEFVDMMNAALEQQEPTKLSEELMRDLEAYHQTKFL